MVTFLLCGVLLVSLLMSRISGHIVRLEDEIRSGLVTKGAEAAQIALTQSIEREWDSLSEVASQTEFQNPNDVRSVLNAVVAASRNIAWAGFADMSGEIRAGFDRLGEGEDASRERWFQEGLVKGSLGQTTAHHTSVEPVLLDLSRPVLDDNGQAIGVLVYRLKSSWVRQLIAEIALGLEFEVVLVDSQGTVLIDARSDASEALPESIGREIRAGRVGAGLSPKAERIGPRVFAVVPSLTPDRLPYLGWHMIVIAPTATASDSVAGFTKQLAIWIVGALGVSTLFPMILVAHFVRPIERLANTARSLADGKYEYPDERCFSREAAILSASLARLQTQLRLHDQSERLSDRPGVKQEGNVHGIRTMQPAEVSRRSNAAA